MRQFVQRTSSRAGSPQNGQPDSSRRQIAANARIPMSKTILSHTEPVPHPPQTRRPDEVPESKHLPSQERLQTHHPSQGLPKRDPYDTDADSINTTQPGTSVTGVEDGQGAECSREPRFEEGEDSNGEDEQEYSSDEDGEEDEDDGEAEYIFLNKPVTEGFLVQNFGLAESPREDQLKFIEKYRVGKNNDRYGDGGSYPTTTSGFLDETADAGIEGSQDLGPEKSETTKEELLQALLHTNRAEHQMQQHPKTFQQAAALRGSHRSKTTIPVPERTHRQLISHRQTPYQPEPIPQAYADQRQAAETRDARHLPQRAVRPYPGIDRFQAEQPDITRVREKATSSAEHAAAARPSTTIQPKENMTTLAAAQPFSLHEAEEPTVDHHMQETPVEDYDKPALFDMKYDDLRNEDFDIDPRAVPPVLSEDILQKDIEEQMVYVHSSLEEEDQSMFFKHLPTSEWQDAGDWFLEKFGDLIQRTKEARQKKRKLAQSFEAEVEKRHHQVSKRQRSVQVALDKMKNQGQNIIPKTPMGGS